MTGDRWNMIDISRDKQLRKELLELHEKIKCQVYLVQNLVGSIYGSYSIYEDIDEVYDQINNDLGCTFIVIESSEKDLYGIDRSKTLVKKEMFEMSEKELFENREQLKNELDETNKKLKEIELKEQETSDRKEKERELEELLEQVEELKKELGK